MFIISPLSTAKVTGFKIRNRRQLEEKGDNSPEIKLENLVNLNNQYISEDPLLERTDQFALEVIKLNNAYLCNKILNLIWRRMKYVITIES